MNVISVYEDVLDNIAKEENGRFTHSMYRRMSKRAELRLMDWLTGDVAGQQPPTPYLSQKNKDWLIPFIMQLKTQVVSGAITIPADYYQYENFYRLGSKVSADCEEDEATDECNTPIELLDGQQFHTRCTTYIEELKPSMWKPIAKIVGSEIQVIPADLGSVTLEYIRYPVFAELKSKEDPVYNNLIPDPDTSTNYEWPEGVRDVLVYMISDSFANHTREQALKQTNAASGKGVRG